MREVFGKNLALLLLEKGITVNQLAENVPCSPEDILQHIRQDAYVPGQAFRIASTLGVYQ